MRSILKAAMLAVGAVALAATLATPASADPPPPPVDATNISAVGSDTIHYLVDSGPMGVTQAPPIPHPPGQGVGSRYNNQTPAPANQVANWYATGTAQIQIKPGAACLINRPDGSSAGITALINDTNGCIDVARSSRAPAPTDKIGTNSLMFFPFAEDEVRYARSVTPVSNVPEGLTASDLVGIYECTTTNWNTFVGRPGVTYDTGSAQAGTPTPKLPQTGSGTRSFFLSLLQAAAGRPINIGACVDQTVQEHDATPIRNDPNAVAPFSKARSIYPVNLTGVIKLNVDVPGFPNVFVGYRPVYLVARNLGGFTVDPKLRPLLTNGTGGFLCGPEVQDPTTGEVVRQGFGLLPGHTNSFCGTYEYTP